MFKTISATIVQRLSDGVQFPATPANTDYAAYLKWLDQGNTPEPADPLPVPSVADLRKAAYTNEADPLFFKAQRQEIDIQEWYAKVDEIRARYPDET